MHCKKIALSIIILTGLVFSNGSEISLPIIQKVWNVSDHYKNINNIKIRIIRFKIEKEGWKTFDQISWKKKEGEFYSVLIPNIESINEFIKAAGDIFESDEKRNDFLRLMSILYCGDVGRIVEIENKSDEMPNKIIAMKFKDDGKEFHITLFFNDDNFIDRVDIKRVGK